MRAYVAGAGGKYTEAVRGVVYADVNGQPGPLSGTTPPIWVGATVKAGWVDIPFSSPLRLSAGTYWLGLQFGGWTRLVRVGYDNGAAGAGRRSAVDAWDDGPSSPFGSATNDSAVWAVYATVSTTSVGLRSLSLDQKRAAAAKAKKTSLLKRRH
jgi:hypothetical protein